MPDDVQAPQADTVQETEATIAKRGPGRPPKQRGENLALAAFEEAFRTNAQGIILEAMEELRRSLRQGKISGSQLAVAVGILKDKLAASANTKGPNAVHLHLHGGDRKELLASVLGNAASRLGSAKRESVSIKQVRPILNSPQSPKATPSIDAELVPAATPAPGPSPTPVDSKSPDEP